MEKSNHLSETASMPCAEGLDDAVIDGEYVVSGQYLAFDIRSVAEMVRKLGRPLTDSEFDQYVY